MLSCARLEHSSGAAGIEVPTEYEVAGRDAEGPGLERECLAARDPNIATQGDVS